MSGPLRPAHARRPSTGSRVAVLVGAVVLILLLMLLVTYCVANRGGRDNGAPGSARSASATPVKPGPSSAAKPPVGKSPPLAGKSPPLATHSESLVSPGGSAGAGAGVPGSVRPGDTPPGSARPGATGPSGSIAAIGPGGSATTTSTPRDEGPAQPGAAPTPSGAPGTGGGSGPGVRHPALLAIGILLLFAAAGLVLFRAWPPDMRP